MTTSNMFNPTPRPAQYSASKRGARRILIIDNHPIVREGLRRVIDNEPDLDVCAEADTARDARNAIRDFKPDAMIADIGLKQGDGIELVRDVRAHYPRLPILVLSSHDETIYAERLLSVGANGYLMKHASGEEILASLRRVLDGEVSVSADIGFSMIRKSTARGDYVSANPVDRLSNRELQILHLIGKGLSTRQAANALNLSVKTVESHRQRIKTKLTLHSGAQLLRFAINWFTGQETGTPQYGFAPAREELVHGALDPSDGYLTAPTTARRTWWMPNAVSSTTMGMLTAIAIS